MDILTSIVEVCIIPLLGILTKYLVDYLSAKRDELNASTQNETAQKYTTMICDTISKCVIATNQTYVNSLKDSNSFTKEAQEEAFSKTMTAVLAILSEDAKAYITSITGDTETYLTQLIEAEVNKNKGA